MENSPVGIVLDEALTPTARYLEYKYDGAIGEIHVKFESYLSTIDFSQVNSLTIRKPDGITFVYTDSINNDLLVDFVEVRNATDKVVYRGKHREILDVAQEQFSTYLRLINEEKNGKKRQEERKRLEEILKILKQ